MTKRKNIIGARQQEVEALCNEPDKFSFEGKDLSELNRLHKDLGCLIDQRLLPPSLEPNAKRLRCHIKSHIHIVA